MAMILDELTLRNKLTDEYLCSVVMDCDNDTSEGYCIEFYDNNDASASTSFGLGKAAKNSCRALFEALSNFCTYCAEKTKYNSEEFWNMIALEYEDGWVLTDSNGQVHTTKEDSMKLLNFIKKWEHTCAKE